MTVTSLHAKPLSPRLDAAPGGLSVSELAPGLLGSAMDYARRAITENSTRILISVAPIARADIPPCDFLVTFSQGRKTLASSVPHLAGLTEPERYTMHIYPVDTHGDGFSSIDDEAAWVEIRGGNAWYFTPDPAAEGGWIKRDVAEFVPPGALNTSAVGLGAFIVKTIADKIAPYDLSVDYPKAPIFDDQKDDFTRHP